MRSAASRLSLHTKVLLGTLLPLLTILAISSSFQYLRHRGLMLEELRRSAANAARIVQASLHRAMLTNDRLAIGNIVTQIAAQRGVRRVFILDKEGHVAVSTVPRDVGATLSIKDSTCQVCHRNGQTAKAGSLIMTDTSGQRVLRSVTSIVKGPRCQACHPRDDATYGVLMIDFSTESVEAQLARERRDTILWSLGALALLAVAIVAIMRRLVVGPLERLTEVVRRVGRGELSQRVGLAGGDEIGELSRAFDSMAEGLEGKATLERQVSERTVALQLLYEELQKKEALRGQLLAQLWTVQEDERRRIARELHDHTSQALTSLLVGLKMLAEAADPAKMRERVRSLRAIAAQTLEDVHDLAVQLRPSVLDDMGLVAGSEHMAKTFSAHFGIPVHFQAVGFEGRRLPPAVETAVYRIVQEALTNVARHAQAANADVLLECRGDRVLALVEDDGHGFDVAGTLGQRGSGRLGLFGMQERATLVGGTLSVESSSTGTTVVLEVPLVESKDVVSDGQDAGAPGR